MANRETEKQKNNLIVAIVKVARPVHWIKNISIFAAIFLTGFLFDKNQLPQVVLAFVAFCFATSATYVLNDILDI